ncbi:YjbH domain-containing protein [Caenimonas terrae]|uniref:YjbH domain-containing protein n=1 Tax=Caenimonas terrae TaxID=696074 RepID=A0ABW0NDJ9_9BURK
MQTETKPFFRCRSAIPQHLRALPAARWFWIFLILGGTWTPATVGAQSLAVSSQGNTGGLTIPSAYVLETGTLAVTYGNFREPGFSPNDTKRNWSGGIGLVPHVEVFGRFVDYSSTTPGSAVFTGGIRDLSPNIKIQIPSLSPRLPKFAIGMNDFAGGAVNFRSAYGVVSDQYGPLRWSAGYALGKPIQGVAANGSTFKGVFAGGELFVGATGIAVLAEYDGQQKHAGLRYYSPPMAALGGAQLIGSVQRSFGGTDRLGARADASAFTISLVVPLDKAPPKPVADKLAMDKSLPPLNAKATPGMVATAQDRLEGLRKALVAVGLERVRVGTLASNLVVEYENHRYDHNEADAIGVVLGLAVEYAPAGLRRVYAVTHKAGLPIYETSVDIPTFRAFLRDGDETNVRTSMAVDRAPDYRKADVKWQDSTSSYRSPVRIEVRPDTNLQLGTEIGSFDYSVAANVQAMVPLWPGAEIYTSYIQRLANSRNTEEGAALQGLRQQNGLKVVSLQQSFWWTDRVFANLGAGRFNYGAWGVQGESTVFLPGDDTVRLRAALQQKKTVSTFAPEPAFSAAYRKAVNANTWVEAGLQQYSDGSRGPALAFKRWFGDASVQLFLRKGGSRSFVGMELSFPLTPRRGMEPGPVHVSGPSQFVQGLRTRLTSSSSPINFVEPNGVLDLKLDYNAEVRQLNAGRLGQGYLIAQVQRMREAFFVYARDQIPQ